jgi:hypothetical protein
MVWTCKENARKQTATENFRRSMTNHGLTEEDSPTITGESNSHRQQCPMRV